MPAMRAHAPPTGPRAASTRPARGGRRTAADHRRRTRGTGMSRPRPPWPHTGRSTPDAIRNGGRPARHTAARDSTTAIGGTPSARNRMPRQPRSTGSGATTRRADTGSPATGPACRLPGRPRATPHTPGPEAPTICTADSCAAPSRGARIPSAPQEPDGRSGPVRRAVGGSSRGTAPTRYAAARAHAVPAQPAKVRVRRGTGLRDRLGHATTMMASNAAQAGIDRADIADTMGHTAMELTARTSCPPVPRPRTPSAMWPDGPAPS